MPRWSDKLTQRAKRMGYPARSVFKLEDIDTKYRLLSPGLKILELGCAPGSWAMFAAKKMVRGHILGLDLTPVDAELHSKIPIAVKLKTIVQCAVSWDVPPILHGRFNLLLSDMAPKTSGMTEENSEESAALAKRGIEIATTVLVRNGACVVKVFDGPYTTEVREQMALHFGRVKVFKPPSCRKHSRETYVIGMRFRRAGASHGTDEKPWAGDDDYKDT